MATFKQYDKKDGSKAWMFRTYLGKNPTTGKDIETTRRGFKKKKEAQLIESRLQVEFKEKGLSKQSVMTFKEVYELWFDSYSKTVKEATSLNVARLFKNHILPVLGDKRITKISIPIAQKAVNHWAESLKVYKSVLQYASKVMKYAVAIELIDKNPFDNIIRPANQKEDEEVKIKFYTVDQVAIALQYLKDQTKKHEKNKVRNYLDEWKLAFFRLLAFSGLRTSEALALNWSDIDFSTHKMTVNKTMSQTKNGYKVTKPKTKASNRVIDLDEKTIRRLKKWQLKQKEFLFSNCVKDCPIIFSDINGKHTTRQATYFRAFAIADATELPRIGVHGWRHTHASMLYSSGVDMKEAQVQLGHSSIEMTMNIYTHLSDTEKAKTSEKLAKFANF